MGALSDALDDFTKVIELEPNNGENFQQRGVVYYKMVQLLNMSSINSRKKNYRRALEDFRKATVIDRMDKVSWNHMGLCLTAIGKPLEVESPLCI